MDLWKFFETRASEIKDRTFRVVTWVLGFAAAIVAFGLKNGLTFGEFGKVVISDPIVLIFLGIVGMIIIACTEILIRDSGEHIENNFKRAGKACALVDSLEEIWSTGEEEDKQKQDFKKSTLPRPLNHIQRVVRIFWFAFAGGQILGVIGVVPILAIYGSIHA